MYLNNNTPITGKLCVMPKEIYHRIIHDLKKCKTTIMPTKIEGVTSAMSLQKNVAPVTVMIR
jgi:hypothetical protein